MSSSNDSKTGTRQVSFRISEDQHQAFLDLVRTIPGADAGNMFREVFSRGLRDLETFYDKVYSRTCEEVAAEVGLDPALLDDVEGR
jgi:hypothetical protein